jgi:hypothetical protein
MALAAPVTPVRTPSSDETDPRQASGVTTRLVLTYVEREGGREAVQAVLDRTGLAGRKGDLLNENAWFADTTRVALFEAAAEVLEDPHVARHIGEASLDLNVAGPLKLALRALGSPRLIYSNAVKINAKFNLVHRLDLLALSDSRARIRNVPLDGIPWHPVDCDYNIGLMSAAPGLFGRPPARVRHPVCIGHGADECVYDIEWTGPTTRPAPSPDGACPGSSPSARPHSSRRRCCPLRPPARRPRRRSPAPRRRGRGDGAGARSRPRPSRARPRPSG